MKKVKRLNLLIISALFLCSINAVLGQEEKDEVLQLNKNVIYATVGNVVIYFSASGCYERIIKQNMWDRNISSFVKLGFGGYTIWGFGGQFVFAQYGFLTGANKHHFEIGAGPNYFINDGFNGVLPLSATIGWRIQKSNEDFIFRTGISLPEGIYFSVGTSF